MSPRALDRYRARARCDDFEGLAPILGTVAVVDAVEQTSALAL
jgi:hypothetical protein